jgi:hypothetical protein
VPGPVLLRGFDERTLVVAIGPGKVESRAWLSTGERGLVCEPLSLPTSRAGLAGLGATLRRRRRLHDQRRNGSQGYRNGMQHLEVVALRRRRKFEHAPASACDRGGLRRFRPSTGILPSNRRTTASGLLRACSVTIRRLAPPALASTRPGRAPTGRDPSA